MILLMSECCMHLLYSDDNGATSRQKTSEDYTPTQKRSYALKGGVVCCQRDSPLVLRALPRPFPHRQHISAESIIELSL